jgi:hypothetical protein
MALPRQHPIDEPAHRLAAGRPERDHPAVVHGPHRFGLAAQDAKADLPGVRQPRGAIRVRIFLLETQHGGLFQHRRRQMGVRVEHDADRNRGPDQLPHPGQDVALAVPAVLRNHRAVQEQHHHVDGRRGAQIVEQDIAQLLVHRLHRRPGGLGEDEKSRRDLATLRRRQHL